MQAIFTFAIEAFTVTAFAFFSIAFITGFIQYERELCPVTVPDVDIDMGELMAGYEAHHRPIITDTVVPFQWPYRRPHCEPIDWTQWGLRDLRKAVQRSGFGIPAERNGRSLTKPQFVALYEAALLEGAIAAIDAA